MSITINGNGTITGYTPVPNGSITSAKLASGVGGKVLQVVQEPFTGTDSQSVSSGGNWVPTNPKCSITPASATNKIQVVITGVLKDFPIPQETFYFDKGDRVRVGTFGINKSSEDFNFGSWIYNTTVKQAPKKVTRQSSSSFTIITESDHQLLEEDSVEVLDRNSNVIGIGRVLSVISSATLILGDLPGISESSILFIRRRLKRGNSSLHDNITNIP